MTTTTKTGTINESHGGSYSLDLLVDGGTIRDRDVVGAYTAYCYGDDGDQPGEVPLAVLTVETDDATVYVAAETPDECSIYHSSHDSFEAAKAACDKLAETL